MKTYVLSLLIVPIFLASCVSVPRETVELSRVLGNDLYALQNSHRQLTVLYFTKMKEDINLFVDEVYAPFIIHYVLGAEMERHAAGEPSLFSSIESAASFGGMAASEDAMNTILQFHQAANAQILSMRNELLDPVTQQESAVLDAINQSYEQVIHANLSITGYLESVRKVRESNRDALALAGFQNADSVISGTLLRVSELVSAAVKKGRAIDVRSENALQEIEEISTQIKLLTQ